MLGVLAAAALQAVLVLGHARLARRKGRRRRGGDVVAGAHGDSGDIVGDFGAGDRAGACHLDAYPLRDDALQLDDARDEGAVVDGRAEDGADGLPRDPHILVDARLQVVALGLRGRVAVKVDRHLVHLPLEVEPHHEPLPLLALGDGQARPHRRRVAAVEKPSAVVVLIRRLCLLTQGRVVRARRRRRGGRRRWRRRVQLQIAAHLKLVEDVGEPLGHEVVRGLCVQAHMPRLDIEGAHVGAALKVLHAGLVGPVVVHHAAGRPVAKAARQASIDGVHLHDGVRNPLSGVATSLIQRLQLVPTRVVLVVDWPHSHDRVNTVILVQIQCKPLVCLIVQLRHGLTGPPCPHVPVNRAVALVQRRRVGRAARGQVRRGVCARARLDDGAANAHVVEHVRFLLLGLIGLCASDAQELELTPRVAQQRHALKHGSGDVGGVIGNVELPLGAVIGRVGRVVGLPVVTLLLLALHYERRGPEVF